MARSKVGGGEVLDGPLDEALLAELQAQLEEDDDDDPGQA